MIIYSTLALQPYLSSNLFIMKKSIETCLWFNNNAEEAVNFYCSIFKNSKINKVKRWGDVGPGPKGSVLVIYFELNDEPLIALNGGPQFTFSEAISLTVYCNNQEEVDHYWEKLSEGGQKSQCGWLKDKFGLSWQITPYRLVELLNDEDSATADRAMGAMMQMGKIIIADIENAANKK